MDTTIEQIKAALDSRRGTWRQVCEDTGLDYSWLTKFAQGQIKNPGYRKIQTLAGYLFAPDEFA